MKNRKKFAIARSQVAHRSLTGRSQLVPTGLKIPPQISTVLHKYLKLIKNEMYMKSTLFDAL